MTGTMDGVSGLLGGTADRFKRVLETPAGRSFSYMVLGGVVGLILLYYLVFVRGT